MSARVLNPAMMTEMSRNIGAVLVQAASSTGASAGNASGGRVIPSRAALARVRRDLFGPVDHAAARALAERELKAQAALDAERWGFDFRLEVPKVGGSARFEWELVTSRDVVPEPYALRGMPYLRKSSPATPKKAARSPRLCRIGSESPASPLFTPATKMQSQLDTERTPPQESRIPPIGGSTPDALPAAIGQLSFESTGKSAGGKGQSNAATPVLSTQTRKQAAITDFMKSRKRALNGKSLTEPPEKASRNAGPIRS